MATFYSYLVLLAFLFKSSQSAGLHNDIIIGNIPRPRLERQVAQTYYHEPTAEDLEASARLDAFLNGLDNLPPFPETTVTPLGSIGRERVRVNEYEKIDDEQPSKKTRLQ